MENTSSISHSKFGVAGGMLLVLLANISTEDLVKTMVLAATGAGVSFIVSFGMKWVCDRLK